MVLNLIYVWLSLSAPWRGCLPNHLNAKTWLHSSSPKQSPCTAWVSLGKSSSVQKRQAEDLLCFGTIWLVDRLLPNMMQSVALDADLTRETESWPPFNRESWPHQAVSSPLVHTVRHCQLHRRHHWRPAFMWECNLPVFLCNWKSQFCENENVLQKFYYSIVDTYLSFVSWTSQAGCSWRRRHVHSCTADHGRILLSSFMFMKSIDSDGLGSQGTASKLVNHWQGRK